MRKQIAAANWKMNLTISEGETLLNEVLSRLPDLSARQEVIFGIPFPYLPMAVQKTGSKKSVFIAAQNCSDKKSGAYTGEVSGAMLKSIQIPYCIIGHSERREYYVETNKILADKLNIALENGLIPIFCCGEPLRIREEGNEKKYVQQQLEESVFHLDAAAAKKLVIAYEPIWAIGTGKTATTAQAQEMHKHLRSVFSEKYGEDIANEIPILYGGSVKAANAVEIFSSPDVDGGLVGGASLVAAEFLSIIKALKK